MRPRSRGARGPRRATDWEPFTDQAVAIGLGAPLAYYGALLDQNDAAEKDGKLTVTRVVGDVIIYNVNTATLTATIGLFRMGVILADVDGAGNVMELDLASPPVQEMSWLYFRAQAVGTFQTSGTADACSDSNQGHMPNGAHLDIKVARKMTERQSLLLIVQMTSMAGYATPRDFNLDVNIRVLCKLN